LKIPDALANVGGFMSLVLPFITFIYSFYIDNEYYLFLYEHLYRLEIEKDENKIENRNKIIEIQVLQDANKQQSDRSGTPEKQDNSYKHDSSKLNILARPSNFLEKDTNNVINFPQNPEVLPKISPTSNKNIKSLKILKMIKKDNTLVNKDVKKLLEYKDKDKEQIKIGNCERFCYINCCCYMKTRNKKDKNYNLRYELINHAETETSKKFDIIEVFKLFNQLRLLKKLLLDKNQCYLLDNRELHSLTHNKIETTDTIQDLNQIIETENFDNLIEYLKAKEQNLSNIDLVLLSYLKEDIKNELKKKFPDL